MKTNRKLLIAALLFAATATRAQDFAGGAGTQADPWLISTPQQLSNLRNRLGAAHKDKYFKLANDIDVSSFSATTWGAAGWEPVGTGNYEDNTTAFFGHLDGAGHQVTGLWINRESDNSIGLFGATGPGNTIEQLGIIIDNGKGGVKGAGYVGGLVGYNNSNSSITNCHATGDITATAHWAGGLAGYSSGNITDCHATGNVTASGNCAGGLVGYNNSNITNSHATGDVAGDGTVGGLTGVSHGSIVNCYATGNVTGRDRGVGGLTGINNGHILNTYATGDVTGSDCCVGGLAGYNNRDITYSYATGTVTGRRTVGGFVGYGEGDMTSCYFLKITDGPEGVGENPEGRGEVAGLTVAEMKSQGSFAGFDFDRVWAIDEGLTYPYLRDASAQEPEAPSLTVSPETLDFIATGETKTVSVMSDVAWTVELSYASWLTVFSLSGNNNGTITLTAAANTGAARTTRVVVGGGGITDTVYITQAEDETSSATFAAFPETVCFREGVLFVDTPVAERIEVYSLQGVRVYQAEKEAGAATFRLPRLSQGVRIVRGSSGWVRKRIN